MGYAIGLLLVRTLQVLLTIKYVYKYVVMESVYIAAIRRVLR